MKVKLICVGKTRTPFLIEGEQYYTGRILHYLPFDRFDIPSGKANNRIGIELQKDIEGKQILKNIQQGDRLFLLDEKGIDCSSQSFADLLQKSFNQGGKRLVFAIGGAYGFSDEVYLKAEKKIRLSSLTFTHEMIRMIFLEQLYRSMTILKGEPYHHV